MTKFTNLGGWRGLAYRLLRAERPQEWRPLGVWRVQGALGGVWSGWGLEGCGRASGQVGRGWGGGWGSGD